MSVSNQTEASRVTFDPELDDFDPELGSESLDNLDPKWSELADSTFGETAENRPILVEKFWSKIRESSGLEDCVKILIGKTSDEDEAIKAFCLKFLRAGAFDVDKAMEVLTNYLENLKNNWSYFSKCCEPSELEPIFKKDIHATVRHRDRFGRRLCIVRPGLWDTDTISFQDLFCSGYVMCEYFSLETKTQIAGVACVMDARDFGLKQLKNFTLENAKNLSNFVQGSFPVWFHDVHILNAAMFFRVAYQLIKPFLNERIRNSIFFHSDVDSLHRSVDPAILPAELGGTAGPFDSRVCFEAYRKILPHFENVKSFVESGDKI